MANNPDSAGLWDRLLVKQAVATLLIAVAAGAVTSILEIGSEWRLERTAIAREMNQALLLVDGTASKAAFELSQDLADEVVRGLARNPYVQNVRLADGDGKDISALSQPPSRMALPELARWLMGDVVQYQRMLQAHTIDDKTVEVGTLSLSLDAVRLTQVLLDRIWDVLWIGMLRAVLICVPVVLVFHHLITRPLLSVTRAIAEVDPAQPAARPIPIPDRHHGDELGGLVTTLDHLLTRFQQGLDQKAAAERDLLDMTRNLELRVAERTADLEQANRSINDSILYAARLQSALLPPATSLDGFVSQWAVGWQPLDQVGGDFYWAGTFERKAVVAVMDCTGHGVPGAFMSAVASSALVRVLHHLGHDDPGQILAGINRLVQTALHQNEAGHCQLSADNGLDAAICVIDPVARQVHFAGAGLPLIVQSDGQQRTIMGDKISLGYADSPTEHSFTTQVIEYRPGDTFILFTDGLTDQVGGPNRRLLGRKRLETILAELAAFPLDQQKTLLLDRLRDWRGPELRRDDLTVLAFRPC